jgi:dTDP-glucose 4,6-dehydratase/UDP-glucuronate decarboxylase
VEGVAVIPSSSFSTIIQQDIKIIAEELEPILRPLNGTTLLVTGGCGFLCSYFLDTVAYLNDQAWEHSCRMLCVDNLKSGISQRIAHLLPRGDFRFVHHDISKPLGIEEPVSWIIHGASIASPTFYRRYPIETIDVNVSGTRNALELALQHKVRSMMYLSSSEVYGDPDPVSIPTPEEYRGNVSCTGPRACYDESKRLAETLCTVYHRLYGLPVKIVRPFNIYGPGQRLDDRRIIPDLMTAALHRGSIELYSDGRATRAFCYVSDGVRAMWYVLLSNADGEVFNVGNDSEKISIRELTERMRHVAGLPSMHIEHRVSEDVYYLTDNPERRCPNLKKLRTRFPWEPKVSLSEGLGRTLQSYQEFLK